MAHSSLILRLNDPIGVSLDTISTPGNSHNPPSSAFSFRFVMRNLFPCQMIPATNYLCGITFYFILAGYDSGIDILLAIHISSIGQVLHSA